MTSSALATSFVLALALASTPALAEPADKALAEQLFNQGRDLGKADKWSEACPKFEASLRYDATIGTRLNLATCYEKTGKLASAWGQFRDAAELASKAGDKKRQSYALAQASALEPRLPKLAITAPPAAIAGLAITRDGTLVEAGALGTSLYVDPGSHAVVASAPGYADFSTQIDLKEGEAKSVAIPELTKKTGSAELVSPSAPPAPSPAPSPAQAPVSHARTYAGIGLTAAGVVAAGVGVAFGLKARSTFDQAKSVCPQLECADDMTYGQGQKAVSDARSQATTSTVLVIGGGLALAAGVVLWLSAPSEHAVETARLVPVVTDRSIGVAFGARW